MPAALLLVYFSAVWDLSPVRINAKPRTPIPGITGTGVLPNPRDRMVPARERLGTQGMLWNQIGEVRARVPETPSKAHIYLDVSGSMGHILPHLLGLILPYVRSGQADIFQFSTVVEPMPLADLKQSRLQTTGGTDINCVLAHAIDTHPRIRRALILTDGYTGIPRPDLVAHVQKHKLRIHAVLPSRRATRVQLRDIATSIVILPPLRRLQHSEW